VKLLVTAAAGSLKVGRHSRCQPTAQKHWTKIQLVLLHSVICVVGLEKSWFKKNQIFWFKSDFLFFLNRIFAFFSLYYAVKHYTYSQDCRKFLKLASCMLHRIKVPEPVTVKSVIEGFNNWIKQYICFCLL